MCNVLTALGELNRNEESYLRVRHALFPGGIAGATQIIYEGQAGYAKRFRRRITEELRADLQAIPAGKRHLLEIVNEWL